jgi:heavy metal translocating P-type ATPase
MKNITKLAITVTAGILALFFEYGLHQPLLARGIIVVIASAIALTMLVDMIKTLRSGKYGIDILAITAIIATLAVGEYAASLMILIMLTGGDSLEDYAARKANKELRSLLKNTPQKAHQLVAGEIVEQTVEAVDVGDHLIVKPGELIPVDGRVLEGETTVDEASLTGESRPVAKKAGDDLLSGSINGDNSIKMIAEKKAADSQYQLIVKLVKESEAQPAHFVRMADRYAVPFTLAAYIIAGIAWFVSKDPTRFAEVLVVASPCPLILAAPIALVAGMSRSSRNGIIVKTGTTLEKLAVAQTIAFDKTGTITKGALSVEKVHPEKQVSEAELVILAASVEQESSHILARSVVAFAKKQGYKLKEITQLEEVTGAGVKAFVEGKEIRVGKKQFVAQNAPATKVEQTAIYVSCAGEYLGCITFVDTLRPEAKKTIAQLRQLQLDRLLMVTGDQQTIAETIAEAVGIQEVHAECLPQDKIQVLNTIPENQRPVVMVGDGVNDAPSLAVADIGIAMGAHGSSAASETADAVILKDDLEKVSTAIVISRDTMRIAKQSVLIGIFICVALMLIASTGVIPALLGAALQEVIDTVSILSSLRAKNDPKKSHSTQMTPQKV